MPAWRAWAALARRAARRRRDNTRHATTAGGLARGATRLSRRRSRLSDSAASRSAASCASVLRTTTSASLSSAASAVFQEDVIPARGLVSGDASRMLGAKLANIAAATDAQRPGRGNRALTLYQQAARGALAVAPHSTLRYPAYVSAAAAGRRHAAASAASPGARSLLRHVCRSRAARVRSLRRVRHRAQRGRCHSASQGAGQVTPGGLLQYHARRPLSLLLEGRGVPRRRAAAHHQVAHGAHRRARVSREGPASPRASPRDAS